MNDFHCAVCGEPYPASSLRDDARHGTGGSMAAWEARLTLAGAGCPCCEGTAPDDDPERADDRRIRAARDRDGASFEGAGIGAALRILEDRPRAPWVRPAPRILETCAGCGVSVTVSPDDGKTLEWTGGARVHYSYGAPYTYGDLRTAEDLPSLSDWPAERRGIMRTAARRGDLGRWTDGKGADVAFDDDGAPDATVTPDDPPADVAGPRRTYCPGCVETCSGRTCYARIFARSALEVGDTYATGSAFPSPSDSLRDGARCIDCIEEWPTCGTCGEYGTESGDDIDDDGNCETCAEKAAAEVRRRAGAGIVPCRHCGETREHAAGDVPAGGDPADYIRRGAPLALNAAGECAECADGAVYAPCAPFFGDLHRLTDWPKALRGARAGRVTAAIRTAAAEILPAPVALLVSEDGDPLEPDPDPRQAELEFAGALPGLFSRGAMIGGRS